MHEIDNRWESGEVSVAEEHFATGILRGRMLSLARNWGQGAGPWHSSPVRPASNKTWAYRVRIWGSFWAQAPEPDPVRAAAGMPISR